MPSEIPHRQYRARETWAPPAGPLLKVPDIRPPPRGTVLEITGAQVTRPLPPQSHCPRHVRPALA